MKKGFTLIEMLVAMVIFVSVVTAVSTLFVHAIRAQRLNLAYQELLDQTSYVMEYMSRAIRMAMKDDIAIWGYLAKNCLGAPDKVNYEIDGNCLIFRNYKDECQEFCLVGNGLVEVIDRDLGGQEVDLTSSNLNVGPLPPNPSWVILNGEEQTDTDQPLVTILLQVEGREGARIQIQTSISQRNLDTVK